MARDLQFFESARFRRVDSLEDAQLETSLGVLTRRYRCKSQDLVLEPGWHENPATGTRARTWTSPTFRLEELLTPAKFQTPYGVVAGRAVLVRGEALTDGIELSAGIAWARGFRWTECGPCSGEGLEALSWNNAVNRVTIGTEDAEYLGARAHRADWMPRRLEPWLQSVASASTVFNANNTSLEIALPPLKRGECVQLQFIIAGGPADDHSATWFAVDQKPSKILALAGFE
ncbi:MAG: hypothetical protein U0836_01145 [Pirellulales bacterium]